MSKIQEVANIVIAGRAKLAAGAVQAALDEGYTAVKVNFFELRKHGPNVNYLETTGFLSS